MGGEDGPDLPPPASKLRPAWQPAPPGPGEHVYPGVGVRTRPAPDDLRPALDAAEAAHVVEGLWPGDPVVELRMVTTGDFPGTPPQDRLVERPGWVFTYPNTTAVLHGGRNGRHSRPRGPITGVSTVIIDAETGDLVLNCHAAGDPDRWPIRPRPAAPPR